MRLAHAVWGDGSGQVRRVPCGRDPALSSCSRSPVSSTSCPVWLRQLRSSHLRSGQQEGGRGRAELCPAPLGSSACILPTRTRSQDTLLQGFELGSSVQRRGGEEWCGPVSHLRARGLHAVSEGSMAHSRPARARAASQEGHASEGSGPASALLSSVNIALVEPILREVLPLMSPR